PYRFQTANRVAMLPVAGIKRKPNQTEKWGPCTARALRDRNGALPLRRGVFVSAIKIRQSMTKTISSAAPLAARAQHAAELRAFTRRLRAIRFRDTEAYLEDIDELAHALTRRAHELTAAKFKRR